MTDQTPIRGGAPVGLVADLAPVEAWAVACLRRWNDGPDAQEDILREIVGQLGARHGETAMCAFQDLCILCARYGRRPMMRHQSGCKCLGSDEACFANFIGAAADGAREDALMMAMLLVRADIAPCLVGLAETVGLALRRMTLHADDRHARSGSDVARHLH
ncbi:hypothetical protein [Anianabacter salinae]|uniref:hypothetical protein n=1 Tax=Anianabacter salinae TaxID=2851023 RepID=UPI00225E2C8F|nr:hypothetical protein [Anianabacter salinae]MBV0911860.1 hypothetical protein [Anianabacter salinae]